MFQLQDPLQWDFVTMALPMLPLTSPEHSRGNRFESYFWLTGDSTIPQPWLLLNMAKSISEMCQTFWLVLPFCLPSPPPFFGGTRVLKSPSYGLAPLGLWHLFLLVSAAWEIQADPVLFVKPIFCFLIKNTFSLKVSTNQNMTSKRNCGLWDAIIFSLFFFCHIPGFV